MSFQPYQLIFLIPVIAWVMILWKVPDNKKWKIPLLVILALLAIFNPFRFKQPNMSAIEKFKSEEQELPVRITVEKEDFDSVNQIELEQMKSQSKEARNEAIN